MTQQRRDTGSVLWKVDSWFYLRSWQRRPSGKQSLPVPLSGSLPQSSGNSGSFPVATGASVPSSTNLGLRIGLMSWTADMNGCKKLVKPWKAANGNWALAEVRRPAAKKRHWSLIIGCSLDHWCNETAVGLLKRSTLSTCTDLACQQHVAIGREPLAIPG